MPNPAVPIPPGAFDNPLTSGQDLIQPGENGSAVVAIQQRLQQLGFYRGMVDGDYGPLTRQAVETFQQQRGLPQTGHIDSYTLHALGFDVDQSTPQSFTPPPMPNGFDINIAFQMCPNAPRANVQTYLPFVITAMNALGMGDMPMILMALATIAAETGSFAPISEHQGPSNTLPGGAPYSKYDFRKDLGNVHPGDGARFCGRGFIQITGRANYQLYSQKLGIGTALVDMPDLANRPDIAAGVLAWYLKDREGKIRQALGRGDFMTARKAVNGGTNGLQTFQTAYLAGARVTGLA